MDLSGLQIVRADGAARRNTLMRNVFAVRCRTRAEVQGPPDPWAAAVRTVHLQRVGFMRVGA